MEGTKRGAARSGGLTLLQWLARDAYLRRQRRRPDGKNETNVKRVEAGSVENNAASFRPGVTFGTNGLLLTP